jgi:hypothetical protein
LLPRSQARRQGIASSGWRVADSTIATLMEALSKQQAQQAGPTQLTPGTRTAGLGGRAAESMRDEAMRTLSDAGLQMDRKVAEVRVHASPTHRTRQHTRTCARRTHHAPRCCCRRHILPRCCCRRHILASGGGLASAARSHHSRSLSLLPLALTTPARSHCSRLISPLPLALTAPARSRLSRTQYLESGVGRGGRKNRRARTVNANDDLVTSERGGSSSAGGAYDAASARRVARAGADGNEEVPTPLSARQQYDEFEKLLSQRDDRRVPRPGDTKPERDTKRTLDSRRLRNLGNL